MDSKLRGLSKKGKRFYELYDAALDIFEVFNVFFFFQYVTNVKKFVIISFTFRAGLINILELSFRMPSNPVILQHIINLFLEILLFKQRGKNVWRKSTIFLKERLNMKRIVIKQPKATNNHQKRILLYLLKKIGNQTLVKLS